jgi:hypothetical protein
MMVGKATGFKRSAFFKTKDGIIDYMCLTIHFKALQGYPIQVLRQYNVGENVKLVKTDKSENWKLEIEVKHTARKCLNRIFMQRHCLQLLQLKPDA